MSMRLSQIQLITSGVLLGGLLLTGCAQVGSDQPTAEGTVTPTPSSSSPAASPGPTGLPKPSVSGPVVPPPAKDIVVLTGTVEQTALEGGCTVLRVNGGKGYELMGGDKNVLKAGAHVVVRGKIRTDIVTICQMGPVLEVLSSQPA